jgi:hypothetical protein
MSAHPIRAAFEFSGDELSPEFGDALRVQFLASILQPVPVTGGQDREEVVVAVTEEAPRHRKSSTRVVLGIAAAIVVIASLTVVVVNHRSQPAAIDTSRDPAIAKQALISVDELGAGWEVSDGGLTSRAVADIAATVPACGPYLNYAFDSPGRRAPTAGRIFGSLGSTLTEWVYIFPSEAAASKAMAKIAEAGFVTCFNRFLEVLIPAYAPGATVKASTVAAPPMTSHGDRQVVVSQSNTYRSGTAEFSQVVLNTFVQVGRGIVYIDPIPDEHDSRDPAGSIEKALTTATNDLRAALGTTPKG